MKIEASGIKAGDNIVIVCGVEDGIVFFDGNEFLEQRFYELLKERKLIAGTFEPEENSEINVLNVVKSFLFDELAEISVSEFTEQMPFEEGIVY